MTPQQINMTIDDVRAQLCGDPLDVVHVYRGHIAIVLAALDKARARLARAEEARDVAWVRACMTGDDTDAVMRDVLGIDLTTARDLLVNIVLTDADIAAAIRRARGT